MNDTIRNIIVLISLILNLFIMTSLAIPNIFLALKNNLYGDPIDSLMMLFWVSVACLGHAYIGWNSIKFSTPNTSSTHGGKNG